MEVEVEMVDFAGFVFFDDILIAGSRSRYNETRTVFLAPLYPFTTLNLCETGCDNGPSVMSGHLQLMSTPLTVTINTILRHADSRRKPNLVSQQLSRC